MFACGEIKRIKLGSNRQNLVSNFNQKEDEKKIWMPDLIKYYGKLKNYKYIQN